MSLHRWLILSIALSAAWLAASRVEAAPPELPDWQYGASVYLPEVKTSASETTDIPAACDATIKTPADSGPTATAPAKPVVAPVVHAAHREAQPATTERNNRHLAPLAENADLPTPGQKSRSTPGSLSQFALPMGTVYSTLAALALVIGLFLLCMWLLRRGARRSTVALPAEVVSVIGCVPLAARQFAELLRVGNKLVLVSLTPTGAQPLTEVIDPTEVNRLLGLCQQYDPHSTTKAFEDVFRQLSREPAPAELFAHDASYNTAAPPEPAYRTHRREVRNA